MVLVFPGIFIENCTECIVSNNITGNAGGGIWNWNDSIMNGNNTITNNSIETTSSGYSIDIVKSDRNIISGNKIFSSGAGAFLGIRVLGSSYNNIVSNNIENAEMLLGNFGGPSSFNTISNNISEGSNLDGIQILDDNDQNIISGNIVKNATGVGIKIGNSDKTIIIGNITLNNGTNITDGGTNTHPNGASGTNNLALDDLNIIA